MPFTSKEETILKRMVKEYGSKKGKQVFYASAQKGKLGKATKKRHGSRKS